MNRSQTNPFVRSMRILHNTATRAVMDSCAESSAKTKAALDAASGATPVAQAASDYATSYIRISAAGAVQAWTEGDDLGDGEGSFDRLQALLIGIADQDQSGELDDSEQAVYLQAADAAWSYMAGKGVSGDDLDAMFNGDDPDAANAAAERACALLVEALPDGEDACCDDMDAWALGSDGDGATEAALDATYSKKVVFSGGQKQVVRRRISGSVHLSAEQRMALRRAQSKAHSASANMNRQKSLKARKNAGK